MSMDLATGRDLMAIGAQAPLGDSGHWNCNWQIRRYDQDMTRYAAIKTGQKPDDDIFARLKIQPYEVSDIHGNLLTTAGLTRIATLINAGTGNLISTTTARVGAGDGSTAAAIGDTDLSAASGSTHRWFQTSTVTVPSNVWTFVAVFGTSDGNFTWSEFGIDVGTATVSSGNTVNAVLLNRKVSSQGAKVAGQTWTATATITIS